MPDLPVKPTHKAIQHYYAALADFAALDQSHETAIRNAFLRLLEDTARLQGWIAVAEVGKKVEGRTIRPDATLYKSALPRGYWEAKDTADDLDAEIAKKIKKGYPLTNIIFEDSRAAVLYQGKRETFRADLRQPDQLTHLLNLFFTYTEPVLEHYDQALDHFSDQLPRLSAGLKLIVADAHKDNRAFKTAYQSLFELCQTSLNPAITTPEVDEMLVQHLLTERLIRKIFDNPDFTRRNVIAAEIEKVITALVSRSFNRDEYLQGLDTYYQAIEAAAHGLDFSQKQHILNEVYERFFQGYSTKTADTHGIVYTPQPIVDFMCASVVEALQTEFAKSLGDPDVVILDPCTGTGNFIVNLLRRAPQTALPDLYRERLFANEIMLLPYYIAALNIEHAYYDLTGQYAPFEGLCFVDTLSLKHGMQYQLTGLTEDNRRRIQRQGESPITVIIGNPPYNVGQRSENDNNKNRRYLDKEGVDTRIKTTYARDSAATNKNALSDAYVKFFRWASDRLQGRNGIVCFVSNNGFVDQIAFDGMRKHLLQDFNRICVFDLKGNVRSDSMRDGIPIGAEHTVFGLSAMVGVSITLLIRNSRYQDRKINYYSVDWRAKRIEKFKLLEQYQNYGIVPWTPLTPDSRHTWLVPQHADQYASFLPLGSKSDRAASGDGDAIFKLYSGGVKTNRDSVVYDFQREPLIERVQTFIEDYNAEVDRYKRAKRPADLDKFVKYERIKWSRDLKQDLQREHYAEYAEEKVRTALYRPFCKQHLFFDRILNEEIYQLPRIFPTLAAEAENRVILVPGLGNRKEFGVFLTNLIPTLDFAFEKVQCFPFYTYDPDGTNRTENITDSALARFQTHYGDKTLTKWDLFYYVYALLHHPDYRTRFKDNLKRELPRVPFAPDFRAFAGVGHALADLHLNYESAALYPLHYRTQKDTLLTYHVEKMRLTKDKTALVVNDSLTLEGIPAASFDYRLGSRSALDWVIDQYQITRDSHHAITSDPNRPDDPRYIVDLVARIITLSLETQRLIATLPAPF